jgi:dihydroflavonol-4-reductase
VRENSSLKNLAPLGCEIVYGDITDKKSVAAAVQGADIVFHLAALNATRRSQTEELEKVNVDGTANVVRACRKQKVKKLIHVSSVVTLGANIAAKYSALDEKAGGLSLPYANIATKRRGEKIVLKAARSKKLFAVVVNPGMIYGAGDARKAARQGNVQVARGKIPFYTKGGVNVVAVEDVVEGLLAASERGRSGERYILAGENLTMRELLSTIAESAGVRAPRFQLPSWLLYRIGVLSDWLGFDSAISRENVHIATLYHWVSSHKAQLELGFRPTSAKAAIIRSVQWMRENDLLKNSLSPK